MRRSLVRKAALGGVLTGRAGFLPSPPLYGGFGNGKNVHKNSAGQPTCVIVDPPPTGFPVL